MDVILYATLLITVICVTLRLAGFRVVVSEKTGAYVLRRRKR